MLGLVLALLLLGGCGNTYTMSGKVISGSYSTAEFVGPEHEQLAEAGIAYANITLYRDAGKPNMRVVATGRSNGKGQVSIPVGEFGAGWMVERWLLQVVKPGYETLDMEIVLPRAKDQRQLLVILTPGLSLPPKTPDDLWSEYERYR
jgi:hypothetical protein